MGPLEEIQRLTLMELVNALRPFVEGDKPENKEAKRLVEQWDYAFQVWGWNNDSRT